MAQMKMFYQNLFETLLEDHRDVVEHFCHQIETSINLTKAEMINFHITDDEYLKEVDRVTKSLIESIIFPTFTNEVL